MGSLLGRTAKASGACRAPAWPLCLHRSFIMPQLLLAPGYAFLESPFQCRATGLAQGAEGESSSESGEEGHGCTCAQPLAPRGAPHMAFCSQATPGHGSC